MTGTPVSYEGSSYPAGYAPGSVIPSMGPIYPGANPTMSAPQPGNELPYPTELSITRPNDGGYGGVPSPQPLIPPTTTVRNSR